MVDKVSKETRSKIMSAIRSKNTKPEVSLRKALWAKGFRYRAQYGKEKIDIAFPSMKVAIFVDGCFWHGCPIHSHIPKSNKGYWVPKLKKNIERDLTNNSKLKTEGWIVLRFWEHELNNVDAVIKQIEYEIKEKETPIMNKWNWANYTTEELEHKLRRLERSLIRNNDEPEPDMDEINSLKLELADREEKEEQQ